MYSPAYGLAIAWQSNAGNIAFYDVEYQLNGGGFKPWLTATQQTRETFSGVYSLLVDNAYKFRARATDVDGNVGDWAAVPVDLQNPVVISEVAGTWVELYNRTAADIDLDGFTLVS